MTSLRCPVGHFLGEFGESTLQYKKLRLWCSGCQDFVEVDNPPEFHLTEEELE